MPIDPSKLSAMRAALEAKKATPAPTAPVTAPAPTSTPASAPTTPDNIKKYRILLKDLYPFLSSLAVTQETSNVSIADALKKKFDLSSSATAELIRSLERDDKIIDSTGKIYQNVLDNVAKDPSHALTWWEFEEKDTHVSATVTPPTSSPTPTPTVAPVTPPVSTPSPTPEPKKVVAIDKIKFTSGDLFDFLKNKLSKNEMAISSGDLQKEFKITVEDADEIVDGLKSAQILDNENKIVPADRLEEITKDLDRTTLHEFDAPTTAHLGASVTPATTPVMLDVDLSSLEKDSPTSPAGPLPPDATAGEREPKPENEEKIMEIVTKTTQLLIDSFKNKPRRYVITALAVGAFGVGGLLAGHYGKKDMSEDAKPNSEMTVPKGKDSPGTATPVAPNGGAGSASPTSPDKNQAITLNPNYEKSLWWIQLNPEVKPIAEKILKAEDAKSYILPFLGEIKILHEGGSIVPSQKTKEDLFANLNQYNNLMNTVASGNQVDLGNCVITAQDESTKVTKTCTVQNNLGRVVKDWRAVRAQALGGNPYQPFSSGNITYDFKLIQDELKAKANAEAVKK